MLSIFRSFSDAIPHVLDVFAKDAENILDAFYKDIGNHPAPDNSAKILEILKEQQLTYCKTLTDNVIRLKLELESENRDINRMFTPVIAEALEHAYITCCTVQRGM